MLKALMDVRQRSKPPKRDFEASCKHGARAA
jgi:hypothetical protein